MELATVRVAVRACVIVVAVAAVAAEAPTRYRVRDLGVPGAMASRALAMNNAGDVAGRWSPSSGGSERGFLFRARTPVDTGSFLPVAINDTGDAIGTVHRSDGTMHAALWSGGGPLDLGTLGGANST